MDSGKAAEHDISSLVPDSFHKRREQDNWKGKQTLGPSPVVPSEISGILTEAAPPGRLPVCSWQPCKVDAVDREFARRGVVDGRHLEIWKFDATKIATLQAVVIGCYC